MRLRAGDDRERADREEHGVLSNKAKTAEEKLELRYGGTCRPLRRIHLLGSHGFRASRSRLPRHEHTGSEDRQPDAYVEGAYCFVVPGRSHQTSPPPGAWNGRGRPERQPAVGFHPRAASSWKGPPRSTALEIAGHELAVKFAGDDITQNLDDLR